MPYGEEFVRHQPPMTDAEKAELRKWIKHLGGVRATARRLGISPTTVVTWNKGRARPRKKYRRALVEAQKINGELR